MTAHDEYDHLRESADADYLAETLSDVIASGDLSAHVRALAPYEERLLGSPVYLTHPWVDAERHSEARAGGRHLLHGEHARWCTIGWTTCEEWVGAVR